MRERVLDAIKSVFGNTFGNEKKCNCMACDSIDWLEKTIDCCVKTQGEEYQKALKFVNEEANTEEALIELLAYSNKIKARLKAETSKVTKVYMKMYIVNEICKEKMRGAV